MQTPGQEAVGAAQQVFADSAKAKREELAESGQCHPFTVVNFNPVALRLQGELGRYSIPSPNDGRLPRDVLRVKLAYDGRDRVGHLMTVREPHIYGKNINATWHQGGGPGDAIPQRDVMYYLPVAIAYAFLEHFSPIFVTGPDGKASPPPKDARKVYGVLAFKGDIHTLERLLLEEDPAKRRIEVPLATVRSTGKVQARSYRSIETSLDDYLERMFDGQLRYADAVIARAQQKWNGTDEDRKDISASDRTWYRWAIELGYAPKPKAGERTWLNELVTLSAGGADDGAGGLRLCQACRTREPAPNTPFCPKCNAPINTFETFMAGYPVADAWLMALKGEERGIVLAERAQRQRGFDGAPESAATPKPAAADKPQAKAKGGTRGPYKGGSAPAEIPAAASIAMPGEE